MRKREREIGSDRVGWDKWEKITLLGSLESSIPRQRLKFSKTFTLAISLTRERERERERALDERERERSVQIGSDGISGKR